MSETQTRPASSGGFAKAFIPGLVIGLLVGLFIGAFVPGLLEGRRSVDPAPPGQRSGVTDASRERDGREPAPRVAPEDGVEPAADEDAEPAPEAPAEQP